MNKKIAFKCMDCRKINVFPSNTADGRRCIECGGSLNPIGDLAEDHRKETKSIRIYNGHGDMLEEIIEDM